MITNKWSAFSADMLQEMSSEERRAADQKIKEENFFKSLGAGEQEAETEGFQCGRCKQVRSLFLKVDDIVSYRL